MIMIALNNSDKFDGTGRTDLMCDQRVFFFFYLYVKYRMRLNSTERNESSVVAHLKSN